MGAPPRVADATDAERVTAIIVNAFQEDPLWSWAFPDAEQRPAQFARWWGFYVDSMLPNRWVWMTGGGEAAAAWVPPGVPEIPPEREHLIEPMLRGLLGAHAEVVLEGVEQFDAADPTEPHFYLSLVGTDGDHRGRGIGVALLTDNLARIDAQGMPAYLESSNPANLARYERLGFVATGEFAMPSGGPSVTTMWRESRSAQ